MNKGEKLIRLVKSQTINMGNYESAKVECGFEVVVDEKDAGERGKGINRQEQTEVGNLPVQPHFQPFEQGEGEGDEKEETVELPAVLAIVEEGD